ncbi:MAG: hypothetical protein AABZ84_08780 [Pseudomonadota bacterium]
MRAPLGGTADFIGPAGVNETAEFRFNNTLPVIEGGGYAGVEFEWQMDDYLFWLVGFGTWEGSSFGTQGGLMPFQRQLTQVLENRSVAISYNEMRFGARYILVDKPRRYRIYSLLSLSNIFDIDYREDHVLRFITGPAEGFSRTVIVKAASTGVLALQGGLGVDFPIAKRFSLGVEGSYMLGVRPFYLKDPKITTDLQDNDGVASMRLPVAPDAQRRLRYLAADGSSYHDMPLELDGWKLLLRASIYY